MPRLGVRCSRRTRFAALGSSVPVALVATGLAAGGASWAEYGATENAWKAAHVADPNPKLFKGCCFLPRNRDGSDRYYAVQYQRFGGVSRVFGFSMGFVPAISVARARAVVREEAPPRSTLVFSLKRKDCLLVEYKSSMLGRAFRSKRTAMLAGFYSSAAGRFNGRTVAEIIFLPATLGDRSVGC